MLIWGKELDGLMIMVIIKGRYSPIKQICNIGRSSQKIITRRVGTYGLTKT